MIPRYGSALMLFFAAFALFLPETVTAMTFSVVNGRISEQVGADKYISGSGAIEEGDAARFVQFIRQLPPEEGRFDWTISLDSPGGNLVEGMRLGEAFREHKLITFVGRDSSCLSACAVSFLGGTKQWAVSAGRFRLLEPGGNLGYHGFELAKDGLGSTNDALELGRYMNAVIRDFALRMGVGDTGLLASLFHIAPSEIEVIDTPNEIIGLGITLAGERLQPPVGWAEHACRRQVASMLLSMDPLGVDERMWGAPEPLKDLESLRQALLETKFSTDETFASVDYAEAVRPFFLGLDATDSVDILAGRSVYAEMMSLGYWKINLVRGRSFYHDACFALASSSSIITIIVDRVSGGAITKWHEPLEGYPPDQPLW